MKNVTPAGRGLLGFAQSDSQVGHMEKNMKVRRQ